MQCAFQLTNPASEDIAITNVYFTLIAHFSTPGQHRMEDHFQGLKKEKKDYDKLKLWEKVDILTCYNSKMQTSNYDKNGNYKNLTY